MSESLVEKFSFFMGLFFIKNSRFRQECVFIPTEKHEIWRESNSSIIVIIDNPICILMWIYLLILLLRWIHAVIIIVVVIWRSSFEIIKLN